MMFAVPRRFGFLAVVLGLLPAPVLSETPPSSPSGRTWTDPPARGTTEATPVPAPETPRQAAAPAPKRPTHAAVRAGKSARPYTEARVRVAHQAAPAPRRQAVRTAARAPAPAIRRVTMRPPVIRYSYGVVPEPRGAFVYEDERARRIRQAQEAGYLVVRSRSVEFPDGRRLPTYRPVEEEGDD